MSTEIEIKLKEEINLLNKKINRLESEQSEILKYSDMAVVETRPDLRIVNSFGAVELLFEEAIKYFERGENLFKVIYKTTNNTRPATEEGNETPIDEIANIEETVNKFIEGTIDEKTFRIIGEKASGEIFLLLWRIRRMPRTFMHYFKIIPTNKIIEETGEKHRSEIESMKQYMRDIFNLITEGITILDLKNKIMYINDAAKMHFIANDNKLLLNAMLEGKNFQEILATESPDELKLRLDNIKKVLILREPVTYTSKIAEVDYLYSIYPMTNEKRNITGTITITRVYSGLKFETSKQDSEHNKILKALKHYSALSKKSGERIKELEINQHWMMKLNKETQETAANLQKLLDTFPLPVSIQSLPSQKYEYVNKAFEIEMRKPSDIVIGKSDEEVFDFATAYLFITALEESLLTNKSVKKEEGNIKFSQMIIRNANNNPVSLIRAYL